MTGAEDDPRISRRRLLAQAAVAGGILWAAPVIESVESTAAAASAAAPTAIYVYGTLAGIGAGYISITLSGPNTAVCAVAVPPTGTCSTCQVAVPVNFGSCSYVSITAVKNVVTVTPLVVGVVLSATSGSFMVCGGKCYRPTAGTGGSLVFNCSAPGVKCA